MNNSYYIFDEDLKQEYITNYTLLITALHDINQYNRQNYKLTEDKHAITLKFMKKIYKYEKCDYSTIFEESKSIENHLKVLYIDYNILSKLYILNDKHYDLEKLKNTIDEIEKYRDNLEFLKEVLHNFIDLNILSKTHIEEELSTMYHDIKTKDDTKQDKLKRIVEYLKLKKTIDEKNKGNIDNFRPDLIYVAKNNLPKITIESVDEKKTEGDFKQDLQKSQDDNQQPKKQNDTNKIATNKEKKIKTKILEQIHIKSIENKKIMTIEDLKKDIKDKSLLFNTKEECMKKGKKFMTLADLKDAIGKSEKIKKSIKNYKTMNKDELCEALFSIQK